MTRTPAQCEAAVRIVAWLDVIRTHIAMHPVAVPVHVSVNVVTGNVTVLLDTASVADTAAGLISWADTLIDAAGEVWRVHDGVSVHLSVTGRTPSGIVVRVFDSVDHHAYTVCGVCLALEPGQRAPLPLDVLRALADRVQAGP